MCNNEFFILYNFLAFINKDLPLHSQLPTLTKSQSSESNLTTAPQSSISTPQMESTTIAISKPPIMNMLQLTWTEYLKVVKDKEEAIEYAVILQKKLDQMLDKLLHLQRI